MSDPSISDSSQSLRVFIPYSRSDAKCAYELVAGLEFDGGFEISIDRHSIRKGEDWKARLRALIEAADTDCDFLRSAGTLYPEPITVKGKGDRWLREELDTAIERLSRRRRETCRVDHGTCANGGQSAVLERGPRMKNTL